MNNKTIISCNITGNNFTKEESLYIPMKPKEIAESALIAAEKGASIVIVTAREEDGTVSQDIMKYEEIVNIIRSNSNVIIDIDNIGRAGYKFNGQDFKELSTLVAYVMEEGIDLNESLLISMCKEVLRERLEVLSVLKPDVFTIRPGTFNLENSVHFNGNFMIVEAVKMCIELNVKPKFECYSEGMLNNVERYILKNNVLDDKVFYELGFNQYSGLKANVGELIYSKDLLPEDSIWSAHAEKGGNSEHSSILYATLVMNGHIRTGLGDTIYLKDNVLAKSNGELVSKAVEAVKQIGKTYATPVEARAILGLGGAK